jgi:hypothetical protein
MNVNIEEAKIENINEPELIECIQIFDQELRLFQQKASDFKNINIERYARSPVGNGSTVNKIKMAISKSGKTSSLFFEEGFFDDYCYYTRKERDTYLKDILQQMKEKLDNPLDI